MQGLETLPFIQSTISEGRVHLVASGPWITPYAAILETLVAKIPSEATSLQSLTLDTAKLDTLDAWLLERIIHSYRSGGREAKLVGKLSAPFRQSSSV